MKRVLKILGTTLILIVALALFVVGPLYYTPVTNQVAAEQIEPLPEEETILALADEGENGIIDETPSGEVEEPGEPSDVIINPDDSGETELPEVVEVKDLLGNKVMVLIGLNGLVDKIGLGLFTAITSYLSGALFIIHIILVIKLAKKTNKPEKTNKVKKVKEGNKNNKKVEEISSPLKNKTPNPTPTNKSTGRGHNVKF